MNDNATKTATKKKDIYMAKALHEFSLILMDLGDRLNKIEKRALTKAAADLFAAGTRIGIEIDRELRKEQTK